MTARNVQDIYPLSPLQEGIVLHALLEPDQGVYVDQLVSEVAAPGGVDAERFRAACEHLCARHAVLRTAVSWEQSTQSIQLVLRDVRLPLTVLDWRDLPEAEQEERLAGWLAEDRRRGFELAAPPLLRLALIRRSDADAWFVATYHHVILDAWSAAVLCRELVDAYERPAGGPAPAGPPTLPYRAYVDWLRARRPEDDEPFWRDYLHGITGPTPLAFGRRPGSGEGDGAVEVLLTEEETDLLRRAARGHSVTLYTLVQGAWALLLSRCGGGDDPVFGLALAGRPHELPGVETAVGLFINTLPARVRVRPDATVESWLRELHGELAALRRHEFTPLVRVQEWSPLPPGVPLFESVVAFENVPGAEGPPQGGGELRFGRGRYLFRTNYPLNLLVVPGREMLLRANYDAGRFEGDAVQRLLRCLRATLLGLARSPGRALGSLPVVDGEGHEEAMRAWSPEPVPYPDRACIHHLFEEQARLRPHAAAVEADGLVLTYGELDRRAEGVARRLRAEGVGPETRVGVFAERSAELVVSVLAVLKAGGAYVPLDPAYPPLRLARMLEAAGAPVLLSPGYLHDRLPPFSGRILDPDEAAEEGSGRVGPEAGPDNTAYVIFTSGSTGEPKGILLPHRGLCNMLPDWNRRFGVRSGSRVLQFASFSFDAATWEIFSALIAGATLCFGSRTTVFAPRALEEMLRGQRITHALLPPSLLAACGPAAAPELEAVAAIGERCTAAVAHAWAPGRRFVNAYGPAEATITVSLHEVAGEGPGIPDPPIGRALANLRLYALDPSLHPAPVGVPAELYVAGIGLARGYVGRPGATAERFLPDPFCEGAGERMYRTGDRVRMRPDGTLEFLGRADAQVKVRGVRIEPAEVEAVLADHPGIGQAVVAPREGEGGGTRLVAYLVCRGHEPPSVADLRAFVRRSLPEAMVPAAWVFLDALPLSPNGKVQRSALPDPPQTRPDGVGEYVPPRGPREELLAQIFAELLRVDRVGANDNFFALGGDSILGMRLIARARRAGMWLTPRHLFESGTLAELAGAADGGAAPGAAVRPEAGEALPLSPMQRWFLDADPVDPDHFSQAVVLTSAQPLDPEVVREALGAVVSAHDALRLRVERSGGGWAARIAAPGEPVALDVVEAGEAAPTPSEVAGAASRCRSSLGLTDGPLLRAALLRGGGSRRDRLVLAAHHFAVDAVSWGILLEDLDAALREAMQGRPVALPPSPSVAVWMRWLTERAHAPEVEAQLPYWSRLVAAAEPLPADTPGGENTVASAGVVEVAIPAGEATLLRSGAAGGDSPEDVLLAALLHALRRWTGRDRATIAVEGHGRGEDGPELSRTVGWMTTLAPLLLEAPPGAEGEALLRAVRDTRRARPDGGAGYGLLRHLRPDLAEAEPLRSAPDPDLCFNYLGRLDGLLPPAALLEVVPEDTGVGRSPRARRPFLLEVDAWADREGLRARWTFSRAVHDTDTIAAVAGDFREALVSLLGRAAEPALRFPGAELSDADLQRALLEIEAQCVPAAAHPGPGREP